MTDNRWYRSSRNRRSSTWASKSRLVAATTRTSTVIERSPPTRVIRLSCNARRTLAWASRLMSPISSRNRVPPSACSNLPIRCLVAPVNAPFSCPNSSDSINSDGIAAQLTSTSGPSARADWAWTWRATNSLPVPGSPVMSTRASDGATRATVC